MLLAILALPLLLAGGILAWTIPVPLGRVAGSPEGWIAGGGAIVYLLVHVFLRKPERMYLWGHEFAHLLVAKIFLRKVHRFEISSRAGGKVVLDGTNIAIDLAPYIFPPYNIVAAIAGSLGKGASPWVPDVYLTLAAFLFAMHIAFSAEGFVAGQPDLKRAGRPFCAGLVLTSLVLWVPLLMAPATRQGYGGLFGAYGAWFAAGGETGRRLLLAARSLL